MSKEHPQNVPAWLYKFMAYLTTCEHPITLGREHDAAPAADRVAYFLQTHFIPGEQEPKWGPDYVKLVVGTQGDRTYEGHGETIEPGPLGSGALHQPSGHFDQETDPGED